MIDSEELKEDLEQFTGTINYYKIGFFSLLATDGVMYFADKAKAHWLINDIALVAQAKQYEPYIYIEAIRTGNETEVKFTDGNGKTIHKTLKYIYSDLPKGKWEFFIINNVIMLPSEY